jgi:hypothetical protein
MRVETTRHTATPRIIVGRVVGVNKNRKLSQRKVYS